MTCSSLMDAEISNTKARSTGNLSTGKLTLKPKIRKKTGWI
jgi:hypothetical protein